MAELISSLTLNDIINRFHPLFQRIPISQYKEFRNDLREFSGETEDDFKEIEILYELLLNMHDGQIPSQFANEIFDEYNVPIEEREAYFKKIRDEDLCLDEERESHTSYSGQVNSKDLVSNLEKFLLQHKYDREKEGELLGNPQQLSHGDTASSTVVAEDEETFFARKRYVFLEDIYEALRAVDRAIGFETDDDSLSINGVSYESIFDGLIQDFGRPSSTISLTGREYFSKRFTDEFVKNYKDKRTQEYGELEQQKEFELSDYIGDQNDLITYLAGQLQINGRRVQHLSALDIVINDPSEFQRESVINPGEMYFSKSATEAYLSRSLNSSEE